MIKIKTRLIITLLGILMSVPLFGSSVSAGTVNCGGLNGENKAICEASISACDNQDNEKGQACRKGFREAYRDPGKKMDTICKGYNGDNKKSCEHGVRSGRDAKKESERKVSLGNSPSNDKCGSGKNAVNTKIDLGCLGDGNDNDPGSTYKGPGGAIGDMAFALIRFLTYGVGIVITISIIAAGIQYATSEGNPETTMAAKGRIQASVISLVIYVFIFSIVQFLVPGGLFN